MKKRFLISMVISMLALTGCTNSDIKMTDNETSQNESNNISINENFMQTNKPQSGDMIATIKTNQGDISLVLFPEMVPETVKNFTELAKDKKYDNVIFHRVIKDFMIQGGDIEHKDGYGGYSYKGVGTSINDEFHPQLKNIRGAISMANSGPNTNGSQFFLVHAPATPYLDGKHSVFGQVYNGIDVVDKIANVETDDGDKPIEDVIIKTIVISEF